MSGDEDSYIADIALAADRISEIVAAGVEAFAESWVLRSAAERQLEIIGEASRRLSDELADRHPEIPLSRARGMRNVIAHQYRNVDHELVWEMFCSATATVGIASAEC